MLWIVLGEHYFKKYNYNYKVSDKRSNKLYTLVSNYEYDKKIDIIIMVKITN